MSAPRARVSSSPSRAEDERRSTFKILLTTDNHLGFAERDVRRGDDSFTTFEEILRAGRVEHDVDLILLGGDLFHENKPSLGCLTRTCSLFRKYVLGDKTIEFALLSDPAKNFPTHALPIANFQDPNLNVALPVFAIHGNHDDPVGGTSALDILATNGYINYFGCVTSLEEIVLEPILLRKGETYIALYGLGNVRDERLHRCFRLKKVHFRHPKPVAHRKWFTILVLHQNRGVRGAGSKAGIYESMLAGYELDLVIWGNEHEQRIVPEASRGFDVIQPGSTVLTSLSAQECNPKHYGILEVRGTAYRLTPFPLRSVRPVVRRTVELWKDNPTGRTLDAVEDYLRSVVEEMVQEAEMQVRRIPDDVLAFHPNIKFPLMRLAVNFTDAESTPFPQPNLNRFGQLYMDVIANPNELLRPIRPKPQRAAGTMASSARGHAGWASHAAGVQGDFVFPIAPQLNTLDIRAKVAEVFHNNAKDACTLLSEPEVSAAVYAFAEKGERNAIDERIDDLLSLTQRKVWQRLGNGSAEAILKPDAIRGEVEQQKLEINRRYARANQPLANSAAQAANAGVANAPPEGGEDSRKEVDAGDELLFGTDQQQQEQQQQQQQQQEQLTRLFEAVELPDVTLAHTTTTSSSSPTMKRAGQAAMSDVDAILAATLHGEENNSSSSTALVDGAGRRRQRRRLDSVLSEEEDDEGNELDIHIHNNKCRSDELPTDGLDHVTVDRLVERALQEQQQQQSASRNTGNGAATAGGDERYGGDVPTMLTPHERKSRTGAAASSRGKRGRTANEEITDVNEDSEHEEDDNNNNNTSTTRTMYPGEPLAASVMSGGGGEGRGTSERKRRLATSAGGRGQRRPRGHTRSAAGDALGDDSGADRPTLALTSYHEGTTSAGNGEGSKKNTAEAGGAIAVRPGTLPPLPLQGRHA